MYLPFDRSAKIRILCNINTHTHTHTSCDYTDYEPHADRPDLLIVSTEGAGKASSPLPPPQNPPSAPEGIMAVKGLGAEESEESSKLVQEPESALALRALPLSPSSPYYAVPMIERGFKPATPSTPDAKPLKMQTYTGVHWGYWGEMRTLEEILCSDLRMSGFNSPAFVTPELSQERRKMLLGRTVHLKGHLALQPSARILTHITAPTLEALAISFGQDSRHEVTVAEDQFVGLGLANKHCKVSDPLNPNP